MELGLDILIPLIYLAFIVYLSYTLRRIIFPAIESRDTTLLALAEFVCSIELCAQLYEVNKIRDYYGTILYLVCYYLIFVSWELSWDATGNPLAYVEGLFFGNDQDVQLWGISLITIIQFAGSTLGWLITRYFWGMDLSRIHSAYTCPGFKIQILYAFAFEYLVTVMHRLGLLVIDRKEEWPKYLRTGLKAGYACFIQFICLFYPIYNNPVIVFTILYVNGCIGILILLAYWAADILAAITSVYIFYNPRFHALIYGNRRR